MLQALGKIRWEPGPDDRVRRALYVIVGADVFVRPCLRIDETETKLRVSIAGLAYAAYIDEKLHPSREGMYLQTIVDDNRDMCVADETHRGRKVRKLT